MREGFRKIWMYLVPLLLLGIVATCDWDFSVKNPFANKNETVDSMNLDEADSIAPLTIQPPTDSTYPAAEPTRSKMNGQTNSSTAPDETRVKKWRLVVGSVHEQSRAQNLASGIQNPQKEILYVEYLDTYRVVYESYNDLRLAQQGFTEVSGRFPEAWLVYY